MNSYFYIDKNGIEQQYLGQVYCIGDKIYGMLTNHIEHDIKYELSYHEAVEPVKGYSSYYTYSYNGEDVIYDGPVSIDDDEVPYYTYIISENVELQKHIITTGNKECLTYIDKDGVVKTFTGKTRYDVALATYFGILE